MQAKGIKMADIYTLSFKNFRSLENATIEVAPLTVVYGPNGSGKSSLIYGLLTLRNFLTNPNQNMPSLFSYPSISLGGLHEVVHRHTSEKGVEISIGISNPDELSSKFTLKLKESGAAVELSFDETSVGNEKIVDWPRILRMTIAIPYQGNQLEEGTFSIFDRPSSITTTVQGGVPQVCLRSLLRRLWWESLACSLRSCVSSSHRSNSSGP